MSGILGLFDPSQDCSLAETLQKMQSAVLHRGLHGVGIWAEGAIGIGHQLFATTPEAQFETSPQIDPEGYVITADVRLDNRDELIHQLGLGDQDLEQLTDPTLLLAAYRKWGHDCPQELLGAFAFLIWDPIKQQLFGARDHLGVKPFYYFEDAEYFAVASEIKALLRSPQVSGELDPIRIADLLTSQLRDPIRTSFQGISRLPAAHSLIYNTKGTLTICQYWHLDPTRTINLDSDETYIQGFRDIFLEAVQCRLRRSVSIGAHLSGGMDSSSVAATAEKLMPPDTLPLKTFSATFASIPECDETPFIQAVLNAGRFEAYWVPADTCGPLTHWQTLFEILDEPALGNGYLSLLMNQEAHRQGVHIMLNGYDGDTTIGHGTLYPHELAQAGKWDKALEEAQLFAERFDADGITPLIWGRRVALDVLEGFQRERKWLTIASSIFRIHQPLGLSRLKLLKRFLLIPLKKSLWAKLNFADVPKSKFDHRASELGHLNQDFLLRHINQIQVHQAQFLEAPNPLTVRQRQVNTISSGMMTFPMELLDQVSAAFQIEPRYPLMDKRLVEFCVALPADQKLRQGWSRYILRKSMAKILPTAVQWRASKTNLSRAFQQGLQKYNQAILTEIFQENPERVSQFINLATFKAAYQSFKKGQSNLTNQWPSITLSLWFKQHQLRTKKQNQ